jgi:hypothetical protein
MDAVQRASRSQTEDMSLGPDSSYTTPEIREKVSARISTRTIKKMRVIMRIWQTQTRVEKEAEERAEGWEKPEDKKRAAARVQAAVDAVDLTHVIDELLRTAADRELQPWGGLPETQEKLDHVLQVVEKQARK